MRWLTSFSVIILLILSGCAGTRQGPGIAESWIGSHKSELVMQWGPPDRIASDERGGEIYVYSMNRKFGQTTGSIRKDYLGNLTYSSPQDVSFEGAQLFFVNEKGIIYSLGGSGDVAQKAQDTGEGYAAGKFALAVIGFIFAVIWLGL